MAEVKQKRGREGGWSREGKREGESEKTVGGRKEKKEMKREGGRNREGKKE